MPFPFRSRRETAGLQVNSHEPTTEHAQGKSTINSNYKSTSLTPFVSSDVQLNLININSPSRPLLAPDPNHFALSKRQDSRAPCPSGNGSTIGDTQSFTLYCGVDYPGYDLGPTPASSILACVDICASYHPLCVGVAFEASLAHGTSNCYPKYSLPAPVVQTYAIDAAAAIATPASSDCSSLGETYTVGSTVFQLYCGKDFPQNDLVQFHEDTMEGCMEQCVSYSQESSYCAAVSYEASQAHGYLNCYLKSSTKSGSLETQAFVVDSAFVIQDALITSSSTIESSIPATSVTAAATILGTTSNMPSPLPSNPATAAASSTPSISLIPSESPSSPSRVWISGIVIGSVAIVALVAVGLLLLRRRQRRKQDIVNPSVAQLPAQQQLVPVPNRGEAADGYGYGYLKVSPTELAVPPAELGGG
jgi:MYXO-CTERM domain-containing protein